MKQHWIFYTFIGLFYLLVMSCANISAPTGGERDTQAPRIVRSNMKDSLTNFKSGKLEFEFDEFVQLKNVQNQLVISPLLKDKPKITSHKRKITVTIPDSLLTENTTYTLSFGQAIQDVHEGNALQNLKYTFSTGAYLDSLWLEGKVMEAKTGLADTSAWVGLYNSATADSDFVNKKPLYIAKVQNGLFRLNNLPNRNFTLFALRDKTNNLRYDSIADAMAFLKQVVNPSNGEKLVLYLFQEEGKLMDTTNAKMNANMRIQVPKSQPISYQVNVDTLNKTKRTFDLNDTLKVKIDQPFKKTDFSKIRLYQDSVLDATAKIILDTMQRTLYIQTEWEEEAPYKLVLSDGFASDTSNKEIKGGVFLFKTKKLSDYGFIKLLQAIDPENRVYLYKQNQLIRQVQQTDSTVTFSRLTPGEYRLEILHDRNGNGVWDTGKFATKQMPEIMERLEQQIVIKANWENKIDLRKQPSTKK